MNKIYRVTDKLSHVKPRTWLLLALAATVAAARIAVNPGLLQPPAPAERISVGELRALSRAGEGPVIVDARARLFFAEGHIPGAVQPAAPTRDLPGDRLIVVYCADRDCADSDRLAGKLSRLGYRQVRVLAGGWAEWVRQGGEVER